MLYSGENGCTFNLTIRLGNDAMSTPDDVADALRRLADRLENMSDLDIGVVRDVNGNTVGNWEVIA